MTLLLPVRVGLHVLLGIFLFQLILIIILKFVPIRLTSFMIISCVKQYFKTGKKPEIHHKWVPFDEICFEMKVLTVIGEEPHFNENFGIDINSIKHAYRLNRKEGRIVRGGSTITQQTAKNVFLYPKRSYFRKAIEAEIAIFLELIWGKKRILEVYLNSAEMGENIYGVESCAEIIFGCTASTLTKEQCAKIVSQLPYKVKDYDSPSPRSQFKYRRLLLLYSFGQDARLLMDHIIKHDYE